MAESLVTLPMYAFPENTVPTRKLGESLAEALRSHGVPARWSASACDDHTSLVAHWRNPSLVLSQSCGLPLVEALFDAVEPVGTFDWKDGGVSPGRYRSVVVSRRHRTGLIRPAINGYHSLSGWASLGVFLFGRDDVLEPVVTGSHAASIAALLSGQADVAAIDGVSWTLLSRYGRAEGLTIIGEGPVIPSLPLITSRSLVTTPELIRAVITEVLASEPGRRAAEELGIEGFTSQDLSDFELVPEWVRMAQESLPRKRNR